MSQIKEGLANDGVTREQRFLEQRGLANASVRVKEAALAEDAWIRAIVERDPATRVGKRRGRSEY